jgi:hypothetical protein
MKQETLKPQDIVVCMKMCLKDVYTTTQGISRLLFISVGEVHMALKRAEQSRLIISEGRSKRVLQTAFLEFVVHGLKYAFPATIGTVVRGMPTGIAAIQGIERYFAPTEALPFVWPHPEGLITGIALAPLFPSVPKAAAIDQNLHRGLALIDAIRGGAAREREFAIQEIRIMLAI